MNLQLMNNPKKVRNNNMSKVSQIYDLVNQTAKESMGEQAITVKDVSSLIALGDSVLASNTDTENFLNTLVDRIARTVFSVRQYESDSEGMVRHPFEFGCIVQKIYVDLPEAKKNDAWEIGKGDYTPKFAPVIKPTAKQKLFNGITTWEVDVTIPDFMFRTAFTNETSMATFIDAIFTAMDNMMSLALENNANLTRASFIARKIKGGKPCGAINLLHEYNTITSAGLTVENALMNAEFLAWASRSINLWVKRMSKMSTLFNEEGYKRHTPKDKLVVNLLQDFTSACDTFLGANTFHDELVKLPMYDSVAYWQGAGESFDFNDTSAINIKLDEQNTVSKKGIIGVIYDYEAMGVTLNERRSTSERNNHDEYTNYYNKANIGYFNDMSENGIVFYLENV